MSKTYYDQIPPETGRKYSITANQDGTSSITDVTQYVQDGTPWGAGDANEVSEHIADTDIHTTPQQKVLTLTHSLDGTVHTLAGLPDAPGIYTAQFKATADFTEGDTFADGYVAKPMGEDTALPDKAFVAGDLVGVVVDTAGKKLGFKLGGGANKWNIFTGATPPDKPDGLFVETPVAPSQVVFSQLSNPAGSWRADLPVAPTSRGYISGVAIGNVMYVVGGDIVETNKNEAYDTVSGLWTTLTPMSARYQLAVAAVGDVMYAAGGQVSGSRFNIFQAFSVVSGLWTTLTVMPTARAALVAASVGTVVYVIGGIIGTGSVLTNKNEAYDTVSGLWTTLTPMPSTRYRMGAAESGGVVYVMGGDSGDIQFNTLLQAYDTVSGLWTTLAPMPTGRYYLSSSAVGAIVYAFGGRSNGVGENKNEAYDIASGLWTTLIPMPTGGYGMAVVAVKNTIYVAGGYTPAATNKLGAYAVNGDLHPAGTLVIEHGYSPHLARLAKDKKVDLTLPIKHTYLHDGEKLSPVPAKVNMDGQGWTDVN